MTIILDFRFAILDNGEDRNLATIERKEHNEEKNSHFALFAFFCGHFSKSGQTHLRLSSGFVRFRSVSLGFARFTLAGRDIAISNLQAECWRALGHIKPDKAPYAG